MWQVQFFWLLATSALWVRPKPIHVQVYILRKTKQNKKTKRGQLQVLYTTHERDRIVHDEQRYPDVDSP